MNIFMKYGVLASQGGEIAPQWTYQYEANVLPDSDGWAKVGTQGSATVNGGIFNLNTMGSTDQIYYTKATLTPANITRIQSRLQVVQDGTGTPEFGQGWIIGDGVRRIIIYMETGRLYSGTTLEDIFVGDMTIYRDVRIEFSNTFGVKVYVDDLETPLWTTAYSNLQVVAFNNILFGDFTSGAGRAAGEVNYDYVYYQLDLAANPDQ
ncbi:hypothetical protein [PinkBerry-associated phage LS06-2018-MD08]|nr:hypothetical protein [PinkBerry-associated phage LS06-2018-MD08]